MTLEQLRVFVAVGDSLSMRRAAEIVHLSQPAVSAAIAALERRYATHLFDRIGRRLELTEAGRSFLPEAKAVLLRAEAARRTLDDLAGLSRGELRLAASQTVATYWLPARLARFARTYPGISLPLAVGNSAQAIAAVAAGEADLGFVEGTVDGSGLDVIPVGGDRLGLYAAIDHPLAGRRVEREDLLRISWAVRERGSGTRDHFVAGMAVHGLSLEDLDIRLELPSNGAVLEAAKAGGLVASVSTLAAASRIQAGTLAEIYCDFSPRIFHMIFHHERYPSAAMTAFRAEIVGN